MISRRSRRDGRGGTIRSRLNRKRNTCSYTLKHSRLPIRFQFERKSRARARARPAPAEHVHNEHAHCAETFCNSNGSITVQSSELYGTEEPRRERKSAQQCDFPIVSVEATSSTRTRENRRGFFERLKTNKPSAVRTRNTVKFNPKRESVQR